MLIMIIKFNPKNMPEFDGTGPQGIGPTGLKRGVCAGNLSDQRGFFGRGRGFKGRMCRFFSGQKNNVISLDEEEKLLTERLDLIRKAKENLKEE